MLIFLIKHELLKLDGAYPVNLREPPHGYIRDKLDLQRDMYNCLLLPLTNSRLNIQLLDEREKLFSALLSMGLCVTASAYTIYETKRKRHFYTDIMLPPFEKGHNLNYCISPDVLTFLYRTFKPEIDSFELPKELQQEHICYHTLREMVEYSTNGLFYNGAGSWLKRYYDYDSGKYGNYVIERIDDPRATNILNDMKARKLLSLSNEKMEYEGKMWQAYKVGSEPSTERLRFLEDQCLKPILEFISAGNEDSLERVERVPQEEQVEVIIDGSNVAYDNVPKGQSPRYRNILLALEYYRKKKLRTKVVVDASLRHKIDEKEVFQKALDEKLIIQAPSRVAADEYILKLASIHQNARIVTNDDFKDWLPKTYLGADLRIARDVFGRRERFVKFKIDGEFIEFYSQ